MYASRKTTNGVFTSNGVHELPKCNVEYERTPNYSCAVLLVGLVLVAVIFLLIVHLA